MFELMPYDSRKPIVGVECLDGSLCYVRSYPASPCIDTRWEIRLFKSVRTSVDLYNVDA